MKPDEIARLRELLAKATPGPWTTGEGDPEHVLSTVNWNCVAEANPVLPYAQVTANSALIAAAISALPALLALAEAVSKAPEVPVEFEPHARLRVIAGGTNSYTGQRVRLVALPDCGEVG